MGMAEEKVMISHGMGQETWWDIAKAQHEPAVMEGSSGKDFGYFLVDLECAAAELIKPKKREYSGMLLHPQPSASWAVGRQLQPSCWGAEGIWGLLHDSVAGYSHLEQISTPIEITFSKSSQIFKFVCESHVKNKPAFFSLVFWQIYTLP